MSPTSYQTAPPRGTGGGAIIVAPRHCVKDPVNSFALFAIPVPCGRFWHGSGWCSSSDETTSFPVRGSRGGGGGRGGAAGVRRALRRRRLRLCHLHRRRLQGRPLLHREEGRHLPAR